MSYKQWFLFFVFVVISSIFALALGKRDGAYKAMEKDCMWEKTCIEMVEKKCGNPPLWTWINHGDDYIRCEIEETLKNKR